MKKKVLTARNLKELIKIINEELNSLAKQLKEKFNNIDLEIDDIKKRLSHLYDAIETDKFNYEDLAPRIRELKSRQDELNKARVMVEAEMAAQGIKNLDKETIKPYIDDLRGLLSQTETIERKSFLRSFIKKIVIEDNKATIYYVLPVQDKVTQENSEVLPIVTYGGAKRTICRTFNIVFSIK
jgi:site-specific DNA recombinase